MRRTHARSCRAAARVLLFVCLRHSRPHSDARSRRTRLSALDVAHPGALTLRLPQRKRCDRSSCSPRAVRGAGSIQAAPARRRSCAARGPRRPVSGSSRRIVDGDHPDLPSSQRRKQVAVEVVAVALQGPHPPFVNRAIVSKRSSPRAATVANVNRAQAGSKPACTGSRHAGRSPLGPVGVAPVGGRDALRRPRSCALPRAIALRRALAANRRCD